MAVVLSYGRKHHRVVRTPACLFLDIQSNCEETLKAIHHLICQIPSLHVFAANVISCKQVLELPERTKYINRFSYLVGMSEYLQISAILGDE